MAEIRHYTNRKIKRRQHADDFIREYERLINDANRIHNEMYELMHGISKRRKRKKKG